MTTSEHKEQATVGIWSPEAEIPEGWCLADLGSVSELVSGAGFPLKYQGRKGRSYPFFKVGNLGDVDSGQELKVAPDSVDQQTAKELGAKIIPPNSVLFAKIGMAIALNRRRLAGVPCCLDNNMMAAIPTKAILPRYLLRLLEQVPFMELASATTVPSLRKSELDRVAVPLPPVVEQRRIVAKIEELLTRVNASRAHLSSAALMLKRFRHSVLAAACSGRLTEEWRKVNQNSNSVGTIVDAIRRRSESRGHSIAQKDKLRQIYEKPEENDSSELPENWRFVSLNKLCASFNYGTSTKSQSSGRVPVLRMGNIQNGEIDWTDLVYTSDRAEIAQYSLEPNTVLFNRTNSPELVGKTAIYRGERPAIFAGYLIRIVPLPELDPEYLNLCLNSNYAREFCWQVKTDAVSQSNINAQKLGTFEVPFCQLPEQHEIVHRVKAFFKLADTIQERVETATKRAEKLTQAILAKAFHGELVPTEAELARQENRAYEPASTLLERIWSEREAKISISSGAIKSKSKRHTDGPNALDP